MDNKKILPYRLKSAWYQEGDSQQIIVDMGDGNLARAQLSDKFKFGQVLRLARRVIGESGAEREDFAHILAYLVYVEARENGESVAKIDLQGIVREILKLGAGVFSNRHHFKRTFHAQLSDAFPLPSIMSRGDPPWKAPLLRLLMQRFRPAGDALLWIDVDVWMRACARLGQHAKNRDLEAMNSLLTNAIPASGFYRPIQQLPGPEAFEGLAEEFPNFTEVAEFYAQQAAISMISGKRRVRLPPVLLLGPPGVGKSVFSMRLAERLGVARFSVSFSGLSHGAVLSGSSSFWGNGRQGQVFDALQLGRHMNPVFLLDEIDKSVASSHYRSPLAPLHQLLELENAKVFQDEYVEIPVDTSWFTWIATANDLDEIPLTIRSRLMVFEVEPPTHEQLWTIGERQYRITLEEFGLTGKLPDHPPAGVLDQVMASPREMGLALRRVIGRMARALAGGRPFDIEKDLKDMQEPERGRGRSRIGFV